MGLRDVRPERKGTKREYVTSSHQTTPFLCLLNVLVGSPSASVYSLCECQTVGMPLGTYLHF